MDDQPKLTDELKYSLTLSIIEIGERLNYICKHELDPPPFMKYELGDQREQPPRKTFDDNDENIKKYYLVSSVYRMCAFLGWIEICRQDCIFSNKWETVGRIGEREIKIGEIESCVQKIKEIFVERNTDSGEIYKDSIFFEEELRAIGETMIKIDNGKKVVLGYADFCGTLFNYPFGYPGFWTQAVIG